MLVTTCTRDQLKFCRAFLAPLRNGTGNQTAYILGIGRQRSDEHYLDSLRMQAIAYGAEWSSSDAITLLPVNEAEQTDLRRTLGVVVPFDGSQPIPEFHAPSIGYRPETGTPLADVLASHFAESMPLIFSGGGSTLVYREFAPGERPGWPEGPAAILQDRPTLIVIDLDAVDVAQTTTVVRSMVSDLERVAGLDLTSRFAALGRAQMWNQDQGQFFTTEETTRIVEAERDEIARRLISTRYRRAIPRERRASLLTAATVRGRSQSNSGPAMIRSAKMDALKRVAAVRLPAFMAAILIRLCDWAGAPTGRRRREVPPVVEGLHADIRNDVGDAVCVRYLGRDYRYRFPIWPSREIALDAPGRQTDASGSGESRGARISELATRQPEVGSDSLSSPTDELDTLAEKAELTEVERDLFFARATGSSIPAWAQERGRFYRMHLSDAKKVWRRIVAKLNAISD